MDRLAVISSPVFKFDPLQVPCPVSESSWVPRSGRHTDCFINGIPTEENLRVKDQNPHQHLWELIQDMKFAMVTTVAAKGDLRSRPLTTQNDAGSRGSARLSFFIRNDSEVADDVQGNPRVSVVYADLEQDTYVSVSGHAQVVQDLQRQKELWSTFAQAWFPGGADDPALRMLHVDIDAAEYWDVKQSKPMQLFKMAKAAVTGKPPTDMGEHREINNP
ncbi:MAG: pyridoxamine 5'-phosphate oxidase family protein [Rubrivivax sp.]